MTNKQTKTPAMKIPEEPRIHPQLRTRLQTLLVGARIVGLRFEADVFGGSPWPVLTLVKGKKQYEVSVSADPEGNGGGWIDEHNT